MSRYRVASPTAAAAAALAMLGLAVGLGGAAPSGPASCAIAPPTTLRPTPCAEAVSERDGAAPLGRITHRGGALVISADRGDNAVSVRQDARGAIRVWLGRRQVPLAGLAARNLRRVQLIASPGRDTLAVAGIATEHPLTILADDRIELSRWPKTPGSARGGARTGAR
jgi:hypothetical protein